jgi:DNA-binding NarL/FixJ family response regulator
MIHILIVEEVRAIGELIAGALGAEPDLHIAGQAATLEEAAAKLSECDVALVNVGGRCETSLQLVRGMRRLAAEVKIVVMGLVCAPASLLECMEAGVAGYALQDASMAEVVQAVHAAYNNEAGVSQPIAALFMSYIAERAEKDPPTAVEPGFRLLTRREREVLCLMQQGLTNLEIAQSLVIELGTVKNHVHPVLRKLNINSRRDTLRLAPGAGPWTWRALGDGRRPESQPAYRPVDMAYPRLARAPIGIASG